MNPIKSYTLSTLRSLCSSLIPKTPELAEKRGPEHRPGAAEIDLEQNVYELFNNLSKFDAGPLNRFFSDRPTLPLATVIALLLDLTALEYIQKGRATTVEFSWNGGPYSWLTEGDRRDLLDFFSGESTLSQLNRWLESYTPYSGLLKFLHRGVTSVPLITYYSEWDGYDQPGGKRIPDPESFTGSVQSWEQSGFPGLKDGYAVFRGYEVTEFEENELE